jgi:RNA polymerase subunit RPABC4/transcription elongation factor Spt4
MRDLLIILCGGVAVVAVFQFFRALSVQKEFHDSVQSAVDEVSEALKNLRDCPHCRSPIHFQATVCPKCQRDVAPEKVCGSCGATVRTADEKCPECGSNLKSAEVANDRIPQESGENMPQ